MIRDEIMMFAQALENQMQYNEKRGKTNSWKEASPAFLFKRLLDETEELRDEILRSPRNEKQIRHESLDVGTLAFFEWYCSMLRDSEEIVEKSDLFGVNR